MLLTLHGPEPVRAGYAWGAVPPREKMGDQTTTRFEVRLCDFGLARIVEPEVARTGIFPRTVSEVDLTTVGGGSATAGTEEDDVTLPPTPPVTTVTSGAADAAATPPRSDSPRYIDCVGVESCRYAECVGYQFVIFLMHVRAIRVQDFRS